MSLNSESTLRSNCTKSIVDQRIRHKSPYHVECVRMFVGRRSALTTLAIALGGCAGKNDPPIGYTPESETESKSPESRTGRSEPSPTGGAGYDFGTTVEKVRAKCLTAGGQFKQTGGVSSCTKRYDDGAVTQITLVEYCQASACRVHSVAILDRADAKTWLTAFESLARGLQEKFGKPDDHRVEVPNECETHFAECVKSGKASAMLHWRWDDGSAVMLRLGTLKQLPAGISVSYANSAGAEGR
jgi:hypothetical protein